MKDVTSLLYYLLSLSEWEGFVEFKENFDKLRDGKNISAIANTALLKWKDFGYIVYWIEDITKNVIGTNFDPNTEKWEGAQNIKLWLSQKIAPKLNLEFYECLEDWKKVVIIEVPAAQSVPVQFDGKWYVRIGESTTPIENHRDLERRIWNNEKNKNFERWIAAQGLSIEEVLKLLDYDTYFRLTKQPIPTETRGFLEKMWQDGIVERQYDGTHDVSVLGAILFAKNVEDFSVIKRKSVRVITYDGISRVKRKNEIEWRKWYAVWFEGLVDFVISQIGNNEEITRALRLSTKIYPEIALREFIANAVVHQDFSITWAWPLVEIFSNRIEITNPGIPLIDTERFIDHPPKSRNEDLASFMRRCGFCEESGSGIDRALFEIEMFQLPAPKFETYDDFTRITMYASRPLKDMSQEDRIRACYQHCALLYSQWGTKMTNKTLRNRLNIPESNYPAASKIIMETLQKGKIKEAEKSKEYVPWWA